MFGIKMPWTRRREALEAECKRLEEQLERKRAEAKARLDAQIAEMMNQPLYLQPRTPWPWPKSKD